MAKTDWSWDKHKYKSKEWVNGAWKYVYNTAANVSDAAKKTTQNVSNTIKTTVNNAQKTVDSKARNVQTNVSNATQNAGNVVKEVVQGISNKVNETRNDIVERQKEKKKEAEEYIQKSIEEKQTYNALPALAIVGLAILGIIAARIAIVGISVAVAYNDLLKQAKQLNDDNAEQLKDAKNDTKPTKARTGVSSDKKQNMQDKINPEYSSGNEYYTNNCYSCTLAYDLQRRGVDASAIPDNDGATTQNILSCYKDAKYVDITCDKPGSGFSKSESEKFLKEMIDTYPEGSYGNFLVTWTPPYALAGGHSMFWEIEDGQVIIRDTQTNKVYKGKVVQDILANVGTVEYFRSDNIDINTQMIEHYTQQNSKRS